MKNFNVITLILLISHILADFHLQSEKLSHEKIRSHKKLLSHIKIHGILLLVPLILGLFYNKLYYTFYISLIILFSHYILDYFKIRLSKLAVVKELLKEHLDILLFLIDQILHVLIILFISEGLLKNTFLSMNNFFIKKDILIYILAFLITTKPSNILFKLGFKKYSYSYIKNLDNTENGAGALIGSLERILSLIFLSMGQISAIGLIYTAKSIARFKIIEEDKRFAEYYLIGTLYSILNAIFIYFLVS